MAAAFNLLGRQTCSSPCLPHLLSSHSLLSSSLAAHPPSLSISLLSAVAWPSKSSNRKLLKKKSGAPSMASVYHISAEKHGSSSHCGAETAALASSNAGNRHGSGETGEQGRRTLRENLSAISYLGLEPHDDDKHEQAGGRQPPPSPHL